MRQNNNYQGALQQPLGSGFDATSTADDVIKWIDLSGKVAIVTGGYAGIGLETVRVLAAAGATVIVPARDIEKARKNISGIPHVELEQLATNHLGHFQLTARLWPMLTIAQGARVINVSSFGHQMAPFNFDDPHFEYRDYETLQGYGQFEHRYDDPGSLRGVQPYSLDESNAKRLWQLSEQMTGFAFPAN